MNEEQLLTIEAFARLKRLQLVATHLHVSPSTVLARLEALEQELGVTLIRHGRPGELTALGQSALNHILDALASMNALRVVAAKAEAATPGLLRIGATPILTSTFLPKWLKSWPAAQNRNIRITVCHSEEVFRRIGIQELDIGFGFDLPLQELPLEVHSLGADPLIGIHSINANSNAKAATPWFQTPFVMCASQQPLWIKLRKALHRSGSFPRKPWIEVDDLDGARSLILQGIGWGILPRTLVEQDLSDRRVTLILPLPWTLPSRQCMVAWTSSEIDPVDENTLHLWKQMYSLNTTIS